MSNRKFAIQVLAEKGEVILSCNGNSMRPVIAPKEAIYIRRVPHELLRENDCVFVRINGNLQVHKISRIDKTNKRWEIANWKNFVNGWVSANAIFGLAVKVEDRVLVSDDELVKRSSQ